MCSQEGPLTNVDLEALASGPASLADLQELTLDADRTQMGEATEVSSAAEASACAAAYAASFCTLSALPEKLLGSCPGCTRCAWWA